MSKLTLHTPIDELYMVGEKYAQYLQKYLNIHTVEDLLYHFPFRYDDLSHTTSLDQVQEGQTVTLQGQIIEIKNIYTRNGKQIQQAKFSDGTAMLDITWFNQPYLVKNFTTSPYISVAGTVKRFGRKLTLTSPKFEIIRNSPQPVGNKIQSPLFSNNSTPITNQQQSTLHTGRLVPVYPETALISSKWLRSRIKPILCGHDLSNPISAIDIPDWLPQEIIESEHFINLHTALQKIHFPSSENDIQIAHSRLGFDELFLLQLQTVERKRAWHQKHLRHTMKGSIKDLEPFLVSLPFKLTDDQQKALNEIISDLTIPSPMNRLLEGDVGSGKTVVAAAAIYLAYKNGLKSVLMAPTEVLANQHKHTLEKLLTPLGLRIGFFTGAKKSKGNMEDFDVYLGTHALLFQELIHNSIGLVIIDEQHRFGVQQRAKLIGNDSVPHVLTMTATPIPRTVALTVYGDLSLSVIKEMPVGRKPIKTWVVDENKRNSSYDWISEQISKYHTQAYFIYPLIDPSDKGTMKEVKAATVEFEKLTKLFPRYKVALLHGRLKSKEKESIMVSFSKGEFDILVSTTVVEVGIDVPNASIMVINEAQRFGLAQLHQLRGRVGRDSMQSYCLLFNSNGQESARLKAMENCQSGIELAELDLKLRGAGQLYGTMQSGFLDLKIASFSNQELVAKTRTWAQHILPKLEKYPLLQEKLSSSIIQSVQPN